MPLPIAFSNAFQAQHSAQQLRGAYLSNLHQRIETLHDISEPFATVQHSSTTTLNPSSFVPRHQWRLLQNMVQIAISHPSVDIFKALTDALDEGIFLRSPTSTEKVTLLPSIRAFLENETDRRTTNDPLEVDRFEHKDWLVRITHNPAFESHPFEWHISKDDTTFHDPTSWGNLEGCREEAKLAVNACVAHTFSKKPKPPRQRLN